MVIDDKDSFGKGGIIFLFVSVPVGLVCSASERYYFSSISLPLKQIHISIVELDLSIT
jgi:hypothetical protein